jgi:hypothetical protein
MSNKNYICKCGIQMDFCNGVIINKENNIGTTFYSCIACGDIIMTLQQVQSYIKKLINKLEDQNNLNASNVITLDTTKNDEFQLVFDFVAEESSPYVYQIKKTS